MIKFRQNHVEKPVYINNANNDNILVSNKYHIGKNLSIFLLIKTIRFNGIKLSLIKLPKLN